MTTFYDRIPAYRKIGRFLMKSFCGFFTWQRIRRFLLASAMLGTLLAIFYAEEDWRGQRDWDAYKLKQKQDGVPFTREEMQPPPIPDNQNFAMTPSLVAIQQPGKDELNKKLSLGILGPNVYVREDLLNKMLGGGEVDPNELAKPLTGAELMDAMKRYDAVLDEFTTASRRPAARFPDGFSLMPDMFDLIRVFNLRATLELINGQTDRSADDIATIFRIAQHLTQGTNLTYQITASADSNMGAALLQKGLILHRWTNDQLAAMQGALEQVDYVAGLRRGFQERQIEFNELQLEGGQALGAYQNFAAKMLLPHGSYASAWLLGWGWRLLPKGWILENIITYNQYYSAAISTIKVAEHRFELEKLHQLNFDEMFPRPTPYTFLAHLWVMDPSLGLIKYQALDVERMDLAKVACALERYRLANDTLPEKLDELTPQFMAKIPTNVMTGGPLHYQRQGDGRYLLFAVGWGGKEDGSQVPGKTDVVWQDAPASK